MENSKSRSLTDVSRLKEVTQRGHVDFKSPRDTSMILSPKGQHWLPPERPGQEDPPSVDFSPRFHTKRKSRIPTLKGSSMTSEKRYSKTRPSNKAVQKKRQVCTSSSESDSNEGFATKVSKLSAQMDSRPRSAPSGSTSEKESLIPKPYKTGQRTTARKSSPVLRKRIGNHIPPWESSGNEADVSRESAEADSSGQRPAGSKFTSAAKKQEEKNYITSSSPNQEHPGTDDTLPQYLLIQSDKSKSDNDIKPSSDISFGAGHLNETTDGGELGIKEQNPLPGQVSSVEEQNKLFEPSQTPEMDEQSNNLANFASISGESFSSNGIVESPFSSDFSFSYTSGSEESFPVDAAETEEDKTSVVKTSTPQGWPLGERSLSKSLDVISLGSLEREKIKNIRSCKSFLMLPHITPSQPKLSSSFRQLLHGCHSYCQMPHITDTESDLDFPTVSVMELVKAEKATGSGKNGVSPTESAESSDEEEPREASQLEQVVDFWDRNTRKRSFTAPPDFYNPDGQTKSYEMFPRCFSSRIRFDQSLERVAELPEAEEIERKQLKELLLDERRVLLRSERSYEGEEENHNKKETRNDFQEEVLCRWRKREKVCQRKRSYSLDDKEEGAELKNRINENKKHGKYSGRLSTKTEKRKTIMKDEQMNDLESELLDAKDYIIRLEERNNQQKSVIEEMRDYLIRGFRSMYNSEMKELWEAAEMRQANSHTYIKELESKLQEKDSELEIARKALQPETFPVTASAEALVKQADMEMSLLSKSYEIDSLVESINLKDREMKELLKKVEKMSDGMKMVEGSQQQIMKKKLEHQEKELKMKNIQIKKLENTLKQDLHQRYEEANEMIESAMISLKTAHQLDEARASSAKQTEEEVNCVEEAIQNFANQKEHEIKELKAELEEVNERNLALMAKIEMDETQYFSEIENKVEMEAEIRELHLSLSETQTCLEKAVKDNFREAEKVWKSSSNVKSSFGEFHKLIKDYLKARVEGEKSMLGEKDKVLELQKEKVKITGDKYEDIKAMERHTSILLALKDQEVSSLKQENLELIRRQKEYIDSLKKDFNHRVQEKQKAFEELRVSSDELLKMKENKISKLEAELRNFRLCMNVAGGLWDQKLKEKDEYIQNTTSDVVQLGKSLSKELSLKEEELERLKLEFEDIIRQKDEDANNLRRMLFQLKATMDSTTQDLEKGCNNKLLMKEQEMERFRVHAQAIVNAKNDELDENKNELIKVRQDFQKCQESLADANEKISCREQELKKLHETSIRASKAFASDYRALHELSNEKYREKDRKISTLEAKVNEVLQTKDLEMQKRLAVLQEQLAVKDHSIQFLTSSAKEAEESVKKMVQDMQQEKDYLNQVIQNLREELKCYNLRDQRNIEEKSAEVERLRKVYEDTVNQRDKQMEEHRLQAESVVKEKEQQLYLAKKEMKEMKEEKETLLSSLSENKATNAALKKSLDKLSNDSLETSAKIAATKRKMENEIQKANVRIEALERENYNYKGEIKKSNQELKRRDHNIKMLQLSVQHLQENLRVRDKALEKYSRTLAQEKKTRESLTDSSRRLSEQLSNCRGQLKELKQSVDCVQEEKRSALRKTTKYENELIEYRNTEESLKQENSSLKLELMRLRQQARENKRQENQDKEKIRPQALSLSSLRDSVESLQAKLKESENSRRIIENKLKTKERELKLMMNKDQKRLTVELEEKIDQASKKANDNISATSDRLLAALNADEAATKQLNISLLSQQNEINRLRETLNEHKKREESSKEKASVLAGQLENKNEVIMSREETIRKLRKELREITDFFEQKSSKDSRKIADLEHDLTTTKATLDHTVLQKITMEESLKSEREILNGHIEHLKETMRRDEFVKKTLEDFNEGLEKDKNSLRNQVDTLRGELNEKDNELNEVKRFARETGFRNKMLMETIEQNQNSGNLQRREPV